MRGKGGQVTITAWRDAAPMLSEFFTIAFRGSIAVGLLIVALRFSGLLH
jgi:hypothetical protein